MQNPPKSKTPEFVSTYAPAPITSLFVYCIVLYLYIYIALLAVHTNQKRLVP